MVLGGLANKTPFWPEALLALLIAKALTGSTWASTWLSSGSAPLTFLLLKGVNGGNRMLPWCPTWLLLTLLNLTQAASSTSWLFAGIFTALCWPLIFLASLYQFQTVAHHTRRGLSKLLRVVHFAADTVALFDLPALEIDVDVAGLMVIRGVTLSLSSLTLVAHGIEVGIKLSDDLEMAIQTDKVTVKLFRSIHVSDVFANVKGGQYEQTFGELEDDTRTADGQVLMDHQSSALLRAAAGAAEGAPDPAALSPSPTPTPTSSNADGIHSPGSAPPLPARPSAANGLPTSQRELPMEDASSASDPRASASSPSPSKVTLAERMTDGQAPRAVSVEHGLDAATTLIADEKDDQARLQRILSEIEKTSEVKIAQDHVIRRISRLRSRQQSDAEQDDVLDVEVPVQHDPAASPSQPPLNLDNDRHMRAAICTRLHARPSIQHPPRQSVRVSTLQNLPPPWLLRLTHRLPLLLRLLLNPLAYFHPIRIDSITAGASGRWMQSMLRSQLFKSYADNSSDIRKLRDKIEKWLCDANFVLGLEQFDGQGLVPVNTDHDITCRMNIDELTLYRTVQAQASLKKSLQLGGADATVLVPSMLLPHHDHLLPTIDERKEAQEAHRLKIRRHDSAPKVVQAKRNLQQNIKDEADVGISVHIKLPACFDQDLLNFITTLVKASKVIEFEKAYEEVAESQVRSFKDFTKLVNTGIKEGVKKATVNAAANDTWIASVVGKVVRKLEAAQGDVGYSGNIPVPLKIYRDAAVPGESKLLP
ncbi:hypothetical protein IE81DRAFT_326531 [Ceraceosorus guamensis]|uniref:Uncharacterized protein n=1 Tax=Ceraceosorus guamensis TaxID=1522189 RepID=A0A316VP96_9BASI|nr:hypothetical protein IE81DRAFT_326531 [Ceraceosorus guamensis]PWN39459.1 hypothetical protein IE81DRAFT_326531 [Ceraceosorus guamensis]